MFDGRPSTSAIQSFTRISAAAAGGLLLGTWRLWLPSEGPAGPPAVPVCSTMPVLAAGPSIGLLLATLLALTAVIVARNPRPSAGLGVLLLSVMAVQDQHRHQAWAYQLGLVLLAAAGLPRDRAGRCCRWVVIGLYAHSGFSKLDVAFLTGTGRQFAEVLLPGETRPELHVLLTAAMPVGELLLAGALAWPGARRLGVVMAVGQHVLLLTILGPWGLGHSVGVLGWNVYFLLAVPVLFWPELEPPKTAGTAEEAGHSLVRALPAWALESAFITTAVVLPLGERFGLVDPWPAWALYAAHTERTSLDIDADDAGELPAELARHFGPVRPDGWRRLDLTAWCLRQRSAPPNPAHRAQLGLAAGLASRFPQLRWRLTWHGPTGVISTEGAVHTWWGSAEICAAARDAEGRFWLNAQPAFPAGGSPSGCHRIYSVATPSLRSAAAGKPTDGSLLLTAEGLADGAGTAGAGRRR